MKAWTGLNLFQGVFATSLGFDNDVLSLNELIGPRNCEPSPPGVFRICSFDGTRTSFGRILLWNGEFLGLGFFKSLKGCVFGAFSGLLTAGRRPSTFGDMIRLFLFAEIFVWSHLFSLVKFETLGLYASCSKSFWNIFHRPIALKKINCAYHLLFGLRLKDFYLGVHTVSC